MRPLYHHMHTRHYYTRYATAFLKSKSYNVEQGSAFRRTTAESEITVFCDAFQDPIASCANYTIIVRLFRLATTSTSILLQLNCSATATVARQRLYGRFG